MVSGAILDPGEPLDSPRALATAGPGVAVVYHSSYERGDRSIEALHNGARFVELVEAIPPDRRHLAVHAGHLTELNAIDRQILDAKAMERSPLLCRAEDVPAAVERYAEMGVTQLAYQPMGDVPEAMARFAEAVGRGAAGRRTG
jgi:5,10-methylenetetrahydromethanopterin reductase